MFKSLKQFEYLDLQALRYALFQMRLIYCRNPIFKTVGASSTELSGIAVASPYWY
jgi:hypothetical protein